MTLRYGILFIVEVLHDYYTNSQCGDFLIVPTQETLAIMRGANMQCKVVGNKLLVVVRLDDTGKPHVPFDMPRKLSFYLQVENVHFYNFTNVGYEPSSRERYYFTNLHENKLATALYLNKKIALYNASDTYAIGSFAANGAGEVFEAIRPSNSGDAHAPADSLFWHQKGQQEYVHNGDLVEITPTLYNFIATPDTNFTINVYRLNTATNIYDVPAMDTMVQTYDAAQTVVPIKLHDITPGKYRIEVNGTSKYVYVDNTAAYNKVFGIIDIFNHLPATSDFALFDAVGMLKGPTFSLRFANRLVLWKYLARTADVTAVKDNLAVYSFLPKPGNQFVSEKPLPLKEKPYPSLYLESTTFGNITQIANPAIDRLNTTVENGFTYYCAEQYLNY